MKKQKTPHEIAAELYHARFAEADAWAAKYTRGGEATQVGERGFHFKVARGSLPEFVPWDVARAIIPCRTGKFLDTLQTAIEEALIGAGTAKIGLEAKHLPIDVVRGRSAENIYLEGRWITLPREWGKRRRKERA